MSVKDLDREPGFWLTVAMLLPFMIAVEIACRIVEAIAHIDHARHRRATHGKDTP